MPVDRLFGRLEMQALTLPACISFLQYEQDPNVAEPGRPNGAEASCLQAIRPLPRRHGGLNPRCIPDARRNLVGGWPST
jgi:hypothetical protein